MAVNIISPLSVCLSSPCCRDIENDEDMMEFKDTGGRVFALAAGLDYKYCPSEALTSSSDVRMCYRMLDRAGFEDLVVVFDNQKDCADDPCFPIKANFKEILMRQASKCVAGDWFIFFYAGHGTNIPDHPGARYEASGQDQAFVLPSKKCTLTDKACLIDDEFALILDQYVPDGVRILCIIDCCHSGSICDIDSFKYRHEIYQISATEDLEEAEDHGFGGTFTLALREAMQELSLQYGQQEFSIQAVYEATERHLQAKTNEQHLSFQYQGTDPNLLAWPLCYDWKQYVQKLAPQFWHDDRVKVAGDAPFWIGRSSEEARRLGSPQEV